MGEQGQIRQEKHGPATGEVSQGLKAGERTKWVRMEKEKIRIPSVDAIKKKRAGNPVSKTAGRVLGRRGDRRPRVMGSKGKRQAEQTPCGGLLNTKEG